MPQRPPFPPSSRAPHTRLSPLLFALTLLGAACLAAPNASARPAAAAVGVEEGTLLVGTVEGRVGLDYDANGSIEERLEGVTVEVYRDGMLVDTDVTDSSGTFSFLLLPETYEVRVDPTDLPPGSAPSEDPDGTATPHTAEVTVTPSAEIPRFDFLYRPLVDLVLVKEVSTADLANDGTVLFTLTVTNLGTATATDVRFFDELDPALELVEIVGCPNPPILERRCDIGDLAPDESFSYTIRVRPSNPTNPIFNRAIASADQADTNPADNVAEVVAAAAASAAIPAVSDAMLMLLALLIAGLGIFALGRGGVGSM